MKTWTYVLYIYSLKLITWFKEKQMDAYTEETEKKKGHIAHFRKG